jgi:hypothetical protein
MNATEMYYNIMEGVNRVGANEEFDYSPISVARYLNTEIKKFIKNKVDPDRNREREGFEADPVRLADLATLVAEYEYDFPVQTTAPDEYQLLLPDGTSDAPSWLYFAGGEVTMRKGLITRTHVPVVLVRQNVGALLRRHPYARTQTNRVLAMIRKGVFTLLTDKRYILIDGKFTYIQCPNEVVISLSGNDGVDCDLPEQVHHEIVALTVTALLEASSAQRYQTNKIETAQFE